MKVILTKGEARQLVQASLVANGCTTIADVVAVQVEKGENLVGYHVTDVDDQDADGEWHLVVTLEEAETEKRDE